MAYWLLESMLHAWFWGDGSLAVTLVAEHDPNEFILIITDLGADLFLAVFWGLCKR
ncbi:MAG: hypothetical protein Q9M09_05075 [Mariprofundaceae bacterium]|nr:hypothetical protein [Mariprofundaceae bacterium]